MKKYLVLAPLFIAMAVMLAGIGAKSAPAKIDAADWLTLAGAWRRQFT